VRDFPFFNIFFVDFEAFIEVIFYIYLFEGLDLLAELLPCLPTTLARALLVRYGVRGQPDERAPLLLYLMGRPDILDDPRNGARLLQIVQIVRKHFFFTKSKQSRPRLFWVLHRRSRYMWRMRYCR
jgi:hypothetical protein